MNQILQQSWDALSQLISESQSILLSTHFGPDGDGLGSEVAFYNHLKGMGKDCRIINSSAASDIYDIIDPENTIEVYNTSQKAWLNNVDISILFDIGDYRRLNEIYPQIKNSKIVIIDHHPPQKENPYYITIIDNGAPATGYMIWKYFQYLNNDFILDVNTANALYASLITDTGSFRYGSTHADAHIMAAHLLNCGVKPYEIHRAIYEQRNLSQVLLMAQVIQALKFTDDGKIAWFHITSKMLKDINATKNDVDGFTEYVRTIKNVEVAFMIQEIDYNIHRVNFRSSGNYIINDVARTFGGGGHIYAAGARVDSMNSTEIEKVILSKLNKKINGADNGY